MSEAIPAGEQADSTGCGCSRVASASPRASACSRRGRRCRARRSSTRRARPTCCCATRRSPCWVSRGAPARRPRPPRRGHAQASAVETLASSDAPADNAWPTAGLLERALAARPPAWCVAELTSNHLAVCSASPQIACITNVWADHVDQHGSLASYLEAKRRIVAFQENGRLDDRQRRRRGRRRARRHLAGARPALHAAGAASDPGAGLESGRLRSGSAAGSRFGPSSALPAAPAAETGLLAGACALLAGASPDAIAAGAGRLEWPRAATRAPRRDRRLRGHSRRPGGDAGKGRRGAGAPRAPLRRSDRRRLRRPGRRPAARLPSGARPVRGGSDRGRPYLRPRRPLWHPQAPRRLRGGTEQRHGPGTASAGTRRSPRPAPARGHTLPPAKRSSLRPRFATSPEERAAVPQLLGLPPR